MINRNIFFLIISLLFFLACSGKIYVGNSHAGFSGFPRNNIEVKDAIQLAEPYLDKTYELRKENRKSGNDNNLLIWVTLKGKYYYIVMDNYPSKTPGFYEKHAVRINKDTGEVISPK
jgi:hypothetical protein